MTEIKTQLRDQVFWYLMKSPIPVCTSELIDALTPGQARSCVWNCLRRLKRRGMVIAFVRKIDRNERGMCYSCGKEKALHGRNTCWWCRRRGKGPKGPRPSPRITYWTVLRRVNVNVKRLVIGDRVRLKVPENTRLHGGVGDVIGIEEWGCHVATESAATGRFRAAWHEVELITVPVTSADVKAKGFTGDICPRCQGSRMLRAGACLACQDCGETSGCG